MFSTFQLQSKAKYSIKSISDPNYLVSELASFGLESGQTVQALHFTKISDEANEVAKTG